MCNVVDVLGFVKYTTVTFYNLKNAGIRNKKRQIFSFQDSAKELSLFNVANYLMTFPSADLG